MSSARCSKKKKNISVEIIFGCLSFPRPRFDKNQGTCQRGGRDSDKRYLSHWSSPYQDVPQWDWNMGEIARLAGLVACLLHVGEVWSPEFWQKLVSTQNFGEINEISKKRTTKFIPLRFNCWKKWYRHAAKKAFLFSNESELLERNERMSSTPPRFNVDIRQGQIWKELWIVEVNNPVHDGLVKE